MIDELLEKIKKLDYQERVKLLDDNKIVRELFLVNQKENPWKFRGVVALFETKDLFKVLKKDIIDKIIEMYPYRGFIYLETLKNKNPSEFETAVTNNKDLMKFLLTKGMNAKLNLSYDFIITLINYIGNNKIEYDENCLFDILFTSLNNKYLQKRFLSENINQHYKNRMLKVFDIDLVTQYINNNLSKVNNKDLYFVIMYRNISLNPNLYQNKEFFKECIVKNTLYETRLELEKLGNTIDITYFENLLLKEELKILSLYNKDLDIIDYLNSDSLFINYLDKNKNIKTNKIILEIIIDYLFQDSSHNVYLNLVELIDYSLNKDIFSKERLTFYKELLKIYKGSSIDIINFFNKYKDIYQASYFYDDLRILKNDSYKKLKESCLKVENITNLKNNDLSNKYNIDIYELNGEKFNMLVSCVFNIPTGLNDAPRNCYTYIGSQNMQVIYKDSYIYGYVDFNIDNIMHVYEDDAYSLNFENKSTSYINRIRNKDELLNTNYRSEIQIKNNKVGDNVYEQLMPSYIVCFDNLNDKSIEAANKLHVPIIIIHKDKYNVLNEHQDLVNYEEEYSLLSYMTSSALEKSSQRKKN